MLCLSTLHNKFNGQIFIYPLFNNKSYLPMMYSISNAITVTKRGKSIRYNWTISTLEFLMLSFWNFNAAAIWETHFYYCNTHVHVLHRQFIRIKCPWQVLILKRSQPQTGIWSLFQESTISWCPNIAFI